MPRCASTFLKRIGLSSHPDINLVRQDHEDKFCELCENDYSFDKDGFLEELKRMPIPQGGKKTVLSCPMLCGETLTGKGSRQSMELIKELFGNIKILLIIRNRESWFRSMWNLHVQLGETLSLKQYTLRYPKRLSHASNRQMINHLYKLFSRDNVKVMQYEDMIVNFNSFMSEIYEFIGVDSTFQPENKRFRKSYNNLTIPLCLY